MIELCFVIILYLLFYYVYCYVDRVGLVVVLIEVCIVNLDIGEDCVVGVVGEIWVRGF